MSLRDYLIGLAFFAATWGVVAAITTVVVHRRLAHLRGVQRLLAAALVFSAGLVAIHLVPLAFGLLARGTVVLAALLGLALALSVHPAATREDEPDRAVPRLRGERASRWLAAAGIAIAAVSAAGFMKAQATVAPAAIDLTTFHLPQVARWIQSGTLWTDVEFVPSFSLGTYPHNGDLVFLSVVLPWRSDAFVRLVNVPFLALIALSVYAGGRELRAPRPTAALMAMVVTATPAVMVTALDRVKPDAFMLAVFGIGVVFLLRHARTRQTSDLVLAGVGLGLAFGARWSGALAVAIVVVVWACATSLAHRQVRRPAIDALMTACVIAAAGGFWLLRNLAIVGNPVYPTRVQALGVTIFDAPRDVIRERYGFSIADYLDDGEVVRDTILPDYRAAFALSGAMLAIMLAVALVMALRRAPARSARALGVAVAAVAIFAAYALAPASAQGFEGDPWPGLVREAARWADPALILAGMAGAWAAARLGRARLAIEAIAVVVIIDAIGQGFDVSAHDRGVGAVLLLAVVGAVAVLRVAVIRRRAIVACVATAVLALAAIGYVDQRRFHEKRYANVEPTLQWVGTRAPGGHRIGIAGGFAQGAVGPILPLFGPRLRNHVAYVGPRIDGMLRHYERRSQYQAALRRGRYDFVLVGRGVVPRDRTPAERWTRELGYEPVARSHVDVLMRRCGGNTCR